MTLSALVPIPNSISLRLTKCTSKVNSHLHCQCYLPNDQGHGTIGLEGEIRHAPCNYLQARVGNQEDVLWP
jgi:hypothetical protein